MSSFFYDTFEQRHVGPSDTDRAFMLQAIGIGSLDQLIDETIPADIQLKSPLTEPAAEPEHLYLSRLKKIASANRVFTSFIGQGYAPCITPSVILRNVLENPGWYTPYTPYQAEIAQGRLEALMNFQTMAIDLTGMDVANASLLDEATAAGEAMTMMYRLRNRKSRDNRNRFFVDERCFPQTLEVLQTRAEPLKIELVIARFDEVTLDDTFCGALVQNPDGEGVVHPLDDFIKQAHTLQVPVAVATDLLACALFRPPGEMGADMAFGSAQRLGVPMGYGGPHAAFFACRQDFVREAPGRIIGASKDRHGNLAYRMALQTREQHIRREKAKSNICTAQALLATMAGCYAVYHGPEGLRAIAERIHKLARLLDQACRPLETLQQQNRVYFDTLRYSLKGMDTAALRKKAEAAGVNLFYPDKETVQISFSETTTLEDLNGLLSIFTDKGDALSSEDFSTIEINLPDTLKRTSSYLTHAVFSSYRSESEMMRYLKRLERKDIGLDTSMIPLGSCTMKLNAASEMIPVTWPEFSGLHPFAPPEQAGGYGVVIEELCRELARITGLHAVSLQPNSGAQGEYAGLLVLQAYHRARGEGHRNVALIPSSAHGTNPASAAMAGMDVVVVKCDDRAYIDLDDLRAKAEQYQDTLSSLMVTYPSTHGIFEENIREVCQIVHDNGGQVYMDGANLNAQVGLTSVASIGADVCHINLHKTFSIPHGGGGPGMGPIAVAEHLAPYLPGHPLVKTGGGNAISAVSAAPFGSANILLISHAYIHLLGGEGMTQATRNAILNANYIKARLEHDYPVYCTGAKGRVAHELIFDVSGFKDVGVNESDIAKRLMDYGFHAPTVSWPIPHSFMVEPTESESRTELDRFCDAMLAIRQEVRDIESGKADPENNVLKYAPHTVEEATAQQWPHPYTREQAVYPLPFVKEQKVWPSVGRIDNAYGDRNLFCSCPAPETYGEPAS